LTEGNGLPLAVVISGANVHDVRLLAETLDNMVIFRPMPTEENPQNLCLDAGFTGHSETAACRGYIPHIRHRGEEKLDIERNTDFKARRWVVEVCHSFLNRFRKLLVRFEKKSINYLGLIEMAFATIVWRKSIPVHNGMVIVG
jgi:putative transposase